MKKLIVLLFVSTVLFSCSSKKTDSQNLITVEMVNLEKNKAEESINKMESALIEAQAKAIVMRSEGHVTQANRSDSINSAFSLQIDSMKNDFKHHDKTNCTLCGICKLSCPTYKFFFDEAVSPRGKATMLKKEFPSKYFYLCTPKIN